MNLSSLGNDPLCDILPKRWLIGVYDCCFSPPVCITGKMKHPLQNRFEIWTMILYQNEDKAVEILKMPGLAFVEFASCSFALIRQFPFNELWFIHTAF